MFGPPLDELVVEKSFDDKGKQCSGEFSAPGIHFFFDGSSNIGWAAARSNGDAMVLNKGLKRKRQLIRLKIRFVINNRVLFGWEEKIITVSTVEINETRTKD
jgi:hypothetical protein